MNDMKRRNQGNPVSKLRGKVSKSNDMTNPTVAGVDLGDSNSLATVLSPSGDLMDRFTFQMTQDGYHMLADRLPENAKIASEATGMVYPFFRAMTEFGYDVTVANTKELFWISKSKEKNDNTDSLNLAKLHMAGILPEAHLMTREEQLTRDLLIQRVRLGQDVTKLKLRILSYLKRGVNELLPKTKNNFSVKRRNAIRATKLGDERDLVINSMLDRLEFLEEQCSQFEASIKGRDVTERMSNLMKDFGKHRQPGQQPVNPVESVARLKAAEHNRLLKRFLQSVADSIRRVFHGKITYASLVWESVDWNLFDFVGVDHYRAERIKDRYADMLKPAFENGKPVVITEFGVQTYEGAEVNGAGLGGNIIDFKSQFFHYKLPLLGRFVRPKLTSGKHVRDESLQARELVDQLTILDNEGVYGAFVSAFVEQIKPYDDDPRYDLDMGSLSLVKYYDGGKRHGTTYPDMSWEPKESFKAVADYFAKH